MKNLEKKKYFYHVKVYQVTEIILGATLLYKSFCSSDFLFVFLSVCLGKPNYMLVFIPHPSSTPPSGPSLLSAHFYPSPAWTIDLFLEIKLSLDPTFTLFKWTSCNIFCNCLNWIDYFIGPMIDEATKNIRNMNIIES